MKETIVFLCVPSSFVGQQIFLMTCRHRHTYDYAHGVHDAKWQNLKKRKKEFCSYHFPRSRFLGFCCKTYKQPICRIDKSAFKGASGAAADEATVLLNVHSQDKRPAKTSKK